MINFVLYFLAKRDVRKRRFYDFVTGEPVRSTYRPKESNDLSEYTRKLMLSSDDAETYAGRGRSEKYIVVSPFITKELSCLLFKKNRILENKMGRYKYQHVNKKIHYKYVKLSKALANLDDMVRCVVADIRCIDEEYAAIIEELQVRYDSNISNREYHLAEANVKAARVNREDFRRKKKERYEQLEFLVSEKIRLLDIINVKIENIKEKIFWRIRCYYSFACNMEPRIPAIVLTEGDFSLICGETLENDHTGQLQDTMEFFERVKKELSFPDEPVLREVELVDDTGAEVDDDFITNDDAGIELSHIE